MKLVFGNQKTYLNKDEVEKFIKDTKDSKRSDVKAIMCPSSLYIDMYQDSAFEPGAQNVSIMGNGTTTGEISASQLKSMGVKYCLVGHSERRQLFKETGEDTNKKIKMLLSENIVPVLCVGETRVEHELKKDAKVIRKEIEEAFVELDKNDIEYLIIAYEPIWAISDGKNPAVIPTNDEIKGVINFIKGFVKDEYSAKVKVLYGGSVNSKNVDELNTIDECDGYLVGGACIKPDDFTYIINSIHE